MDPKTLVNQGVAGTGRAVIYQDRFDPAEAIDRLAIMRGRDRLANKKAQREARKKANEALSDLDYEAFNNMDVQELTKAQQNLMDGLKQAAIKDGAESVLDPTSPAGKLFFQSQKALDGMSLMSEQNNKILSDQMKLREKDLDGYDEEEYAARMKYLESLPTMKDRNDFLTGKVPMPGKEDVFGSGLLVPKLDQWAPIDGYVAKMRDSKTENGDTTIRTKFVDKKALKDDITMMLTSPEWEQHLAKFGADGVDKYVDELVDRVVNTTSTLYQKTEDEKDQPFSFSSGSGFESVNGLRLVYGEDKDFADTQNYGGIDNSPAGVFPRATTSVGIATKKGDRLPNYDYQVKIKSEDGNDEMKSVQVKPTDILRIEHGPNKGKMFLRGVLSSDVPVTVNQFSFDDTGGSFNEKNNEIVIPLETGNNRDNLVAQMGVPLSHIEKNMDEFYGSQAQSQQDQMVEEVEQQVSSAINVVGTSKEPISEDNLTVLENHLKTVKKDMNIDSVTRKGDVFTLDGRKYDMSNDIQRDLFYELIKEQ